MTSCAWTYEGGDLPPKIQRAITRAMDPGFPIELGSSERVAFAALLRRVEAASGSGDFWVRRCNMAELFGKVERTVTNWLSSLEAKGLIRKEQGRKRWGEYSSLTLQLTREAIAVLGLDEDLPSTRKKISSRYKSCSTEGEQSQERHHPGGHFVDESYPQADNSMITLPGGFRVPEECLSLIRCGVSPSGVFKLMKAARVGGHRLGVILKAKQEAISASSNPFAYVLALTKQAVDYSAMLLSSQAQPKMPDPVSKGLEPTKANPAFEVLAGKMVEISHDKIIKVDQSRDDPPQVYRLVNGRLEYSYAIVGAALHRFWRDMRQRLEDNNLKFYQAGQAKGRRF